MTRRRSGEPRYVVRTAALAAKGFVEGGPEGLAVGQEVDGEALFRKRLRLAPEEGVGLAGKFGDEIAEVYKVGSWRFA
jgi:hypothetical protein